MKSGRFRSASRFQYGEPRAAAADAHDLLEHAVIVIDRDVFEQIAEIVAIERSGAGLREELLDGHAMPFEPIEVGADPLEILGAQRAREHVAVRAGGQPAQIRVDARILLHQRMTRAGHDAIRDASFDIGEERRIAAHPAHHRAREEDAEQQPPAPRVPGGFVEALALRRHPSVRIISSPRACEWISGSSFVRNSAK